jgi:hypothetical protein
MTIILPEMSLTPFIAIVLKKGQQGGLPDAGPQEEKGDANLF